MSDNEQANNEQANNEQANNEQANNNNNQSANAEEMISVPGPDGQVYQLTKAQYAAAAVKGVAALLAEQHKTDNKTETVIRQNVEQKPNESDAAYNKRLAEVESELQTMKNQSLKLKIKEELKKANIPEQFHDEVEEQVIVRNIAMKQANQTFDIDSLIKERVTNKQKQLAPYLKQIDAEQKEKDKQATALSTSSGDSGGEQIKEKFTKKDFRSGRLAQATLRYLKSALE